MNAISHYGHAHWHWGQFLDWGNIFLLNAKCLLLTKRNLQIILVQSIDTLSMANRSLFLLFTALVFSVIITITEAGQQILLFEWNSIKFLKYRNAQRAPGCVPKNQNVGRWTRSCPSLGICPSHSFQLPRVILGGLSLYCSVSHRSSTAEQELTINYYYTDKHLLRRYVCSCTTSTCNGPGHKSEISLPGAWKKSHLHPYSWYWLFRKLIMINFYGNHIKVRI